MPDACQSHLIFVFLFLFFVLSDILKDIFICVSSFQDIRLLNSGKPAQHAAEVDRELNKAEKMIRLFFNDVQILKDGRHPQAEQMYHR